MKDIMFGFIALALTGVLLTVRRLFTGRTSTSIKFLRVHLLTPGGNDGSGQSQVADEWPSIIGAEEDSLTGTADVGRYRLEISTAESKHRVIGVSSLSGCD